MEERPDDARPCGSSIGGFEDTCAVVTVGSKVLFAGAHIHDVRVGWVQRDCAAGKRVLGVGEGRPGDAAVGGLPYAAFSRTDIYDIAVAGIDGNSVHAAG